MERAPAALAVLRANLAKLGVNDACKVHPVGVGGWLRKPEKGPATSSERTRSQTFDLVFLDPPYDAAEDYAITLGLLGGAAGGLLNTGALIIAEHRGKGGSKETLEERYGALERTRLLVQGDAALSFYASSATDLPE